MKQEYVEAIEKMIGETNDVSLLDLIYKLLKKEGCVNA